MDRPWKLELEIRFDQASEFSSILKKPEHRASALSLYAHQPEHMLFFHDMLSLAGERLRDQLVMIEGVWHFMFGQYGVTTSVRKEFPVGDVDERVVQTVLRAAQELDFDITQILVSHRFKTEIDHRSTLPDYDIKTMIECLDGAWMDYGIRQLS